MGVFFSIPLYLQVVLGLDALDTGLWVLLGAVLLLMGTIEPEIDGFVFGASMALLGVGMGLMASQLGNVIQSSVGPTDRSEAGGLQYTAQQLGSAIGTALIGAVVITSLTNVFVDEVAGDDRISAEVSDDLSLSLPGSVQFVPTDTLATALEDAAVETSEAVAIVDAYETGQLVALRLGLLVGAAIVVMALFIAHRLPDVAFDEIARAGGDDTTAGDARQALTDTS